MTYRNAARSRSRQGTQSFDPANRGFTLLELLVVIVIIGLLAGLVVPRYFDTVEKSKSKIARAQMKRQVLQLIDAFIERGQLRSKVSAGR